VFSGDGDLMLQAETGMMLQFLGMYFEGIASKLSYALNKFFLILNKHAKGC